MSIYCQLSNIYIGESRNCYFLPIRKNIPSLHEEYIPATLPLYGCVNNGVCLEVDEEFLSTNELHKKNVELIEQYFGITIDEFIMFITYNNYDKMKQLINVHLTNEFIEKLKANGKHDELLKYDFMYIDEHIYNVYTKRIKGGEYYDYYKHYKKGEEMLLDATARLFIKRHIYDEYAPETYKKYREFYLSINDLDTVDRIDRRKVYHPDIELFSDVYFELEYYDTFKHFLENILIMYDNMKNLSQAFSPNVWYNSSNMNYCFDKLHLNISKEVTKRLKQIIKQDDEL